MCSGISFWMMPPDTPARGIRPLMLLDDVDTFDDDPIVRLHAQHDAAPALVAAGDDDDLVALS